MTTESVTGRVNVGEFAGKQFLLDLDRAERAEFYKLLDQAPWEGKTASGHWQVRDLCGHMIDVTEGYLERFAVARAGKEAPAPLGLPIMAQKLDEAAQSFRSLSKADAIARLKTASDRMFEIFDALDEKSWAGEIVNHTYMGPLPAYFFAGFQLIDYSIHSWDIKSGLGRDEPLSDAARSARSRSSRNCLPANSPTLTRPVTLSVVIPVLLAPTRFASQTRGDRVR